MHIREICIRFYKSFNFDYELKATPGATPEPWQLTQDGWMPHVRIAIEADITAIVGANESGKTHLLDAIKIVLTGEGLHQRDFCRSSALFSVERGSRLFPEVGGSFNLNDNERATLNGSQIPLRKNGDLLLLRPAPGAATVVDKDGDRVDLTDAQASVVQGLLPSPYELNTDTPLPDSISISALTNRSQRLTSRKARIDFLTFLTSLTSEEEVTKNAASVFAFASAQDAEASKQQQLGVDLLTKIARIEESSFAELQNAIAEEREGLVNGLIQEMNNSIARHLNVSRWWSQDPEFQLRVSPCEYELVFTIRDRTGTDYSFTERSRGLRYFLSYYVQLLSHPRPSVGTEVLLMDEPDAYLSASGQQDLLKILEHHARPEDSDREDQVIYVTHSPFLINRNAGHRVRVVDKGSRDEGTRYVKDATRNHYEPLRTSLGSFVAETAFIGGDNLFVEGIADQVLLAGMNTRLLRAGAPPSQCLDLNQVTIVPGGANIPYMLYLARGRDQVKPACAVLLDGDDAGQTARKQIKRGGARGKPTVADDLVVVVSEWADQAQLTTSPGVVVQEPEDLIPINVAVPAARRYAKSFLGLDDDTVKALTEENLTDELSAQGGSLWDALTGAFEAVFDTQITKAGFAKELLAYLSEFEGSNRPAGGPALDANFAALIQCLAETLSLARERELEARRDQRLDRIIDTFTADHPNGCTRDRAAAALKRIDAAVDDTIAGDFIQAATARIRRDFKLLAEPLKTVDEYSKFLEAFKNLRHLERIGHRDAATVRNRD
ncbi:AAA family ATPase [Candidatus Mycobacterium wuenschmannii]|uniref:AAA family ATPase n=1 Tax=Candidatus Mycobacterium wuenschmannii TaxID=3027808 RepID=A0ABY8W1C2_9MYCO|nr:AAA family ATPase [Candidatus Mycobacterium wuenschmannii]WIM89674.1 AAA family ATPase [Candidatus Mycobacterium wuenschmannii]